MNTYRLTVEQAFEHWRSLDERMKWCDVQIGLDVRNNPAARRAAKVTGIGELSADGLGG